VVASGAQAAAIEKKDRFQVAALALPGGPQADWQQWDSFLTNVVKKLGADFQPALRDRLGETFLDSSYQLVQLLRAGSADPVPHLFSDAWNRLEPILKQAIPDASQSTANQYASFIRAMDAASSFSGIGQRLGIFRITPDALRSAAGMIGVGGGDSAGLHGRGRCRFARVAWFYRDLADAHPSPLLEQGRLERLFDKASAALRRLRVRSAHAADADFDRLNQWVPEEKEIQDYLVEIRQLLTTLSERVLAKSSLAVQHRKLYRQIIFATGWQESCWRQFIKKGEKLATLASSGRRGFDAGESHYLAQRLRRQRPDRRHRLQRQRRL